MSLSNSQKALLAAGPVESLLSCHGAALIERVETMAKANPTFNYLLGGVWQGSMPKQIWRRIEIIRKDVW
ncbi:MAG: DUF6869 domain-containing protein [Verrucomicrobiales bacterium]